MIFVNCKYTGDVHWTSKQLEESLFSSETCVPGILKWRYDKDNVWTESITRSLLEEQL
jgi:hypothetical protein